MSIVCVRRECYWQHKFNDRPRDFLHLIRNLVSNIKKEQSLKQYQLYDINIKRSGNNLTIVFYFVLNNQHQQTA